MGSAEYDPIQELTGDTTVYTSEERELAQLGSYLSYKRWDAGEALLILMGIDPEQSLSVEDGLVTWLPGVCDEWRRLRKEQDKFPLIKHLELVQEDLRRFIVGEVRTPKEWLELSLKKNHEPPWLEGARSIPKPREEKSPEFKDAPQSPQSSGGINKNRRYRETEAEIIAELDRRKIEDDFDETSFIKKMQEQYNPNNKGFVGDITIKRWIRHHQTTNC